MKRLLAAAVLALVPAAATAHVTLKIKDAKVGGPYEAVFRVGHGCSGAPTTAIRVRVPEGVVAVQPAAKPGWTVEAKTGAYARPHDHDGVSVAEGVTEVAWTGGNLKDGTREEFAMRVFLAKDLAGQDRLYFPVVQQCTGGKTERWIEIPASGGNGEDDGSPAPSVRLRPQG